ncbi:MAG: hydroxymethylglutaryl-CoA lyase [Alphaproteobacteria bacterium]|nr:hydroxymethylglutaryl-CoA lyase [Alphaproteobacteria bacterium]
MSHEVEIVEVSPRDGIQNEPILLSTDDKCKLVTRAHAAGLKRVEVTSFVNPSKVPQMADAEAVIEGLPAAQRESGIALVLNARGYERALASGIGEINLVVVASDTFGQRNQGRDADQMVALWHEIAAKRPKVVRTSVTIAAAFGCPFEGDIPLRRIAELAEAICTQRPDELALADTIGVATPRDIQERVRAVQPIAGDVPLRLHLHNTRNTGFANAWVGFEEGVRTFDSSLGGIGGCPFAPRATGNIATEDLVYMFERAGVSTGIDLDAAIGLAQWLEKKLGITAPGQVMRAGGFPEGVAA